MHKHLIKLDTWRLWASAVLWGFALSGCGGTGTRESVDSTVALSQVGNHMVVALKVNGQDARFIIDTGASHVAVTNAFAIRLNLPRSEPMIPGTGGGAVYNAQPTVLQSIQIGSAVELNHTAYIVPVPEEFSFDGIVGNSFLESYALTLDYQTPTLRLQTPGLFMPPAGIEPISIERWGALVLAPMQVAGHQGKCQIDTGANSALTVLRPAVDVLSLRNRFSPQLRTLTGRSAGGDLIGDMVRIPLVKLGAYAMTQVVTELSLASIGFFAQEGILCNVGHEILSRFKVTMDYPGRRLYLEPTVMWQAPFAYSRGGIAIGLDKQALTALFVLPGGPADQAGIQTGDRIERINGQASGEVTSDTLSTLLRGAVGTEVSLRTSRISQPSTDHTLVLRDVL